MMCFPWLKCTGFTVCVSSLSSAGSSGNEVQPSRLPKDVCNMSPSLWGVLFKTQLAKAVLLKANTAIVWGCPNNLVLILVVIKKTRQRKAVLLRDSVRRMEQHRFFEEWGGWGGSFTQKLPQMLPCGTEIEKKMQLDQKLRKKMRCRRRQWQ